MPDSQLNHSLQRASRDLAVAMQDIQRMQDRLLQAEKLAALGVVVAGVAHELNTPIGNGLTVASTLQEKIRRFEALQPQGLRRSDLESFVQDAEAATDLLVRNLEKAGALVARFKEVAATETPWMRESFSLSECIVDVRSRMSDALANSGCRLKVNVPPKLNLVSYEDPLLKVLCQVVENSLLHGYEGRVGGDIEIDAEVVQGKEEPSVRISVSDSGCGIPEQFLGRVFDPFFTTKLGRGGCGLGLYMAHNLVTGVLAGQISIQSRAPSGTVVQLLLPVEVPPMAKFEQ